MNGNSKAEKLDSVIRRHVTDAVNEEIARYVITNVAMAQSLKNVRESIAIDVAYRMTRTYPMLELTDIIQWKKRD